MSPPPYFCKVHMKDVEGKSYRRKRKVFADMVQHVNLLCVKKGHQPNVVIDDYICNSCYLQALTLKNRGPPTTTASVTTTTTATTAAFSSSASSTTTTSTSTSTVVSSGYSVFQGTSTYSTTAAVTTITVNAPSTGDTAVTLLNTSGNVTASSDAIITNAGAVITTSTDAITTTTTAATTTTTAASTTTAATTTTTTDAATISTDAVAISTDAVATSTDAVATSTDAVATSTAAIITSTAATTTSTSETTTSTLATTTSTDAVTISTDAVATSTDAVATSTDTVTTSTAATTTCPPAITTSTDATTTSTTFNAGERTDSDTELEPFSFPANLDDSVEDADQPPVPAEQQPGTSFRRRVNEPYEPSDAGSSDSEPWADEDDAEDVVDDEHEYVFSVRAPVNTGKHCFVCKSKEDRHAISLTAMALLYIDIRVFVPSECRVCLKHLMPDKQRFTDEAISQIKKLENVKAYVMKESELEKLVETLTMLAEKPRIDFTPYGYYKDEDYITLTGLTRQQFNDLYAFISPHLARKWRFGSRTALAVTLTKLHTGMPQDLLGLLFKMSQSTVSRSIRQVCKQLHEKFVPVHLGYRHISREDYIRLHHTNLANTLCEVDGTNCIYVMDGTYFFCGKSSNFDAQRGLFSGQKGVPLCKSMIICSPSGYILAVEGMYKSNGKNNDASITKHMVQKDGGFLSFVRANDMIIWDRGFRDSSRLAAYYGLSTRMPHLLPKTAKQHTDLEANDSRITTSIRWVVESVNSRLKRKWKFLDGRIENTYLPHLGKYVEICAALTNAYCPPLARNRPEHIRMAQEMLARRSMCNMILEGLNSKRIVPASKRSKWEAIRDADLVDFPYLSIEDLRAITFGIYQIKLARSYAAEHMDDSGEYLLYCLSLKGHSPADDKLIRVKIQSRHTQVKKYDIYVQYSPTKVNDSAITGWYCTCKAGARVLGCCAHVCSVLYYLGFQRHDPTWRPPAQNIDKNILDASQRESTPGSDPADDTRKKQAKKKQAKSGPKRKLSTRKPVSKRGRGRLATRGSTRMSNKSSSASVSSAAATSNSSSDGSSD